MFCRIIGFPLLKPRSVKLWRDFFKKKKIKISMKPLQIEPINFKKKFKNMINDKRFLAAAVTMPYKKKLYSLVNVTDRVTKFSRSINLIIKKKNNLYGFNTDVYGALKTIKKIKIKKNIAIFGYGGSGEAICRVIKNVYRKSKIIVISKKRKPSDLKSNIKFVKRKEFKSLYQVDLFINCSPLGSNLNSKLINQTPIDNKILKNKKKNLVIFDIVYSPKMTLLANLAKDNNIKYINGIQMNTDQANKALKLVYKFYNLNNE